MLERKNPTNEIILDEASDKLLKASAIIPTDPEITPAISLNANKNGNPLVPYEPIDGNPFLINTSKVLNHRWIIAEFSCGDLWGQVLIKYFVSEGKPTDFETVETVLYERQTKE